MTIRSEILTEANALITGDRQAQYGPPAENFERIAAGWRVILGCDVTPSQVALAMAWLTIARVVNGPHRDGFVDGVGYLALAGELSDACTTNFPVVAHDLPEAVIGHGVAP